MIFRDWRAVPDGRKTHTRRPKLEGERLVLRDGMKTVLGQSGRVKWQVDRTYAIQPGRGQPSKGRFTLVDIREEQVQDISEEDARCEGLKVVEGEGYGPGSGCKWLGPGYRDVVTGNYHVERDGLCKCLVGRALLLTPAICAYRVLWNDIWKYRPEWRWDSDPEVWVLVIKAKEEM